MAMNGNTWGSAVKAAVDALAIAPGTPITSGQLVAFWQAVCTINATHIASNAAVLTTAVTAGSATAPGTVT